MVGGGIFFVNLGVLWEEANGMPKQLEKKKKKNWNFGIHIGHTKKKKKVHSGG